MSAELYNAMLESWRGAYAWWKEHRRSDTETFPSDRSLSRMDLMKELTLLRKAMPEWEALSVNAARGVVCRFDRTIRSFYKRCREGGNPGYPRFKPYRRWRSIEIVDAKSHMLLAPTTEEGQETGGWWRLRIKGLPRVKFLDKGNRLATALEYGAKLLEIRLVRNPVRVEIHVVVRHPAQEMEKVTEPTNPVGIDKGLRHRFALSTGHHVPARMPDRRKITRMQRRVSRADEARKRREKEQGERLPHSRSRQKKQKALNKVWHRETERALHAEFRFAHWLVTNFDGIAVEDMNIPGLMGSKWFSKKMSDQRWGISDKVAGYKAGKAGIPFRGVNPAFTSTDCSACGNRQRMPLSERIYLCGSCGMVMCRDCNAARNIRSRAFGTGIGRDHADAAEPVEPQGFQISECETGRSPWGGRQSDAAEQLPKERIAA